MAPGPLPNGNSSHQDHNNSRAPPPSFWTPQDIYGPIPIFNHNTTPSPSPSPEDNSPPISPRTPAPLQRPQDLQDRHQQHHPSFPPQYQLPSYDPSLFSTQPSYSYNPIYQPSTALSTSHPPTIPTSAAPLNPTIPALLGPTVSPNLTLPLLVDLYAPARPSGTTTISTTTSSYQHCSYQHSSHQHSSYQHPSYQHPRQAPRPPRRQLRRNRRRWMACECDHADECANTDFLEGLEREDAVPPAWMVDPERGCICRLRPRSRST